MTQKQAFDSAVAELSALAAYNKCSVHFARLSDSMFLPPFPFSSLGFLRLLLFSGIPNLEWSKALKSLKKHLVEKSIQTYVYLFLLCFAPYALRLHKI